MASQDLQPGTVLQHRGGGRVVLDRRKIRETWGGENWWPGWWCESGGGLADFVIDAEDSPWSVVRRTPRASHRGS